MPKVSVVGMPDDLWASVVHCDLWLWSCGFKFHPRLLCTNANSACHPYGVG